MKQPKRMALLAYLMLHDGFVRRDHLLVTFWPRSDQVRGRASLRQALSFLRKALGADVIIRRGNEEVGVDRGRISCDVYQFELDLSAGEIERGIQRYRGDLMEGFFVERASGFHDWLERERTRLRQRAGDAVWAFAERLEYSRRSAEAAFWGKRALSLSAFDEPSVRRLIRLLDRVGDREGAMRAYRGVVRHLASEFGVDPSPETRRLIEQVKSRSEALAPDLVVNGSDRRRFAGRRGASDGPSFNEGSNQGEAGRVAERRLGGRRRSGADRRAGEVH